MHPRFNIRYSLAIVQIIALMICTFAYGTIESVAQEGDPFFDATTNSDMSYVENLQDQRAELQQQAQALQQERQQQANSLAGLLEQKANIEQQIALKQREIDINTQISDSLTAQIYQTDEQLIAAEQTMLLRRQTILDRFEILRQKVRALSKGGSYTALQLLLSSDSYESLLINLKMAARITEQDQAALNDLEVEFSDLQAERTALNQQQQDLQEQLAPFESAEQDLEASKNELLALYNEADRISTQLSSNVTYLHMQYVNLTTQQLFLQNQISQMLGTSDTTDIIAPSTMYWPSPDCTIITSRYKLRRGKWHYGLDIASWGDATGKSIVAAADGTVIFSGSDDSGYGNYVIIDHGYDLLGQRIVTLYAHCHALMAKVGDKVIGGQTIIATVGDTGNSSGAHLHFEVRVNEQAVDPILNGYVSTDGITILD